MTDTADKTARSVYEQLIRAMLVPIKSQRKVWKQMNEVEQEQLLAVFDNELRAAVRSMVDLVAADEMPHIKVILEKVTFADEVQGTIKMPNMDALRHRLADAAKRTVILVVPDYEAHLRGDKPKAEPVQTDLGLAQTVEDATASAWEQEELARKAARKACFVALLEVGMDYSEETIEAWTDEQVTEARAWAAAVANIADDGPLPDMPEFMQTPMPGGEDSPGQPA